MRCRPFLLSLVAAAATSASAGIDYVPGIVLVKPKPGQSAAARAAYKAMGATVVATLPQIGWDAIRVKAGTTVQAGLTKLAAAKSVARAEAEPIATVTELPNDPMVSQQYSLTRMALSQAWDLAKGDASVTVAIIDTGADLTHPDLQASLVAGYDFGNGDADPSDTFGHGSHCSGIAAAAGNNGIGIAGIAYGASIMPVKVFPDGSGSTGDLPITQGILFAADHGANVISMSFGSFADSQMEDDALDYAYAKNVVLIAAAGNSNVSSRFFPAAYPKVIAVGATDSADARAVFSDYGADWVDVAAPGVDILSTLPGGTYGKESGTSMACPNVAGLATLIISQAGVGTLTNEEVRAIIENNCDNVGSWVAKGRVNAYKAILQTPGGVVDQPTANDVAAVEGTLLNGDAPTIKDGDGLSATIRSVKKTGVGLTGSMSGTFAPSLLTPDEVRLTTVDLVFTGDRLSILQVFYRDGLTGKWVILTSVPCNGASQTASLRLTRTQASAAMTGAGEMKLLVRAYVPTRLAGQCRGLTQIDEMKVTFKGLKVPGGTP